MAKLKVFVSSTCYDLNIVRSQLRNFISTFGFEPIMSEYSDVLYDPRTHTHSSCVQEVDNCDMLILIIGSRFGGKAIPKAVEMVDFEYIKRLSTSPELLEDKNNISITQLEVLKAIELSVPIFAFVDGKVLHDHLVYEKNKNEEFISKISFPSFSEKPETAKYIFKFINFLRHRLENNSIKEFSKMEEIESHLRKQWSGLLQRLLYEQRYQKNEERKMDYITEQIADIKTAIVTSISSSDLRETARGAIKYRMLIQFLYQLKSGEIKDLLLSNFSWEEVLKDLNIVRITSTEAEGISRTLRPRSAIIILNDGTFYESRFSQGALERLQLHWQEFTYLNQESRQAIMNAIIESDELRPMRMLRHYDKQFSEVAATSEDSSDGNETEE